MLNLICFEYTLLEFDKLIDWIYAPEDEFREKRASAIAARGQLVQTIGTDNVNYKEIKEIVYYDDNLKNHNIEQLSAKLLFELTINTGFEVSKGSLDDKNQYLIIGRNPKNLFTTSDNLFELVSEKTGEQTKFMLKRYL